MPLSNPVTQIFLPFAVAVVMFALGTTLTFADLRRVLIRPRAFVFGVAAHALLLPLLAFAVGLCLRLPGPLAVGLVLIASCPANAAANIFTLLARGDTMLSICLTAAASLTSVFTVPLFVNAALRRLRHRPRDAAPARAPGRPRPLPRVHPAGAGRHAPAARRPDVARAVETRIGTIGLLVVAAVILAVVWSEKDNVLPALARAGVAALLLNVLSVSLAWGLSALLGLDRAQRIAVGFECGLQNFAMAAFIALTLMRDAELLVSAIAYGLTMWLSAFAVVHLTTRRRRGDATLAS